MNILYTIVGLTFVFAVSLGVITFCVHYLFNLWQERKSNEFQCYMLSTLTKIEGWCDYDFPDVGEVSRELRKCISKHWMGFDVEKFRDDLRKKRTNHANTIE